MGKIDPNWLMSEAVRQVLKDRRLNKFPIWLYPLALLALSGVIEWESYLVVRHMLVRSGTDDILPEEKTFLDKYIAARRDYDGDLSNLLGQ